MWLPLLLCYVTLGTAEVCRKQPNPPFTVFTYFCFVLSHYKAGKARLLHASGLTLPKNLTHRLKFPSLLGVNVRQTSTSIQSPGATVNPAAARCRAELSEGYTAPAPSLGTSTPSAHTNCHHITP